jgi:magnesium-protoporphyrin IX monomethyl ester (oxidative) cyclase
MRFDAGRTRGGIVGRLQQAAAAVSGAINFVRLYFHPVKRHDLPAQIRVAPSW